MWIYFIIVALIIAFCIRSYYTYPQNSSILQTSLSQLSFEMLLEKQPLVIDDKTCKLSVIEDAWFKFNSTDEFDLTGSPTWHTNRYKHCFIQVAHSTTSINSTTDVFIYPASKPLGLDNNPDQHEKLVAIRASPGQVVVVPFHWRYMIPEGVSVQCLGVHDWVTYFLP